MPAQIGAKKAPDPNCARAKRRGKPKVAERGRALVREQLGYGPRPGEHVMAAAEAAEIPERWVIVAADALGVRTRRGQGWLPG